MSDDDELARAYACGPDGIEEMYAADRDPAASAPLSELVAVNVAGDIEAVAEELDCHHVPIWASDEAKAAGKDPWVCQTCGTADGSWPCATKVEATRLRRIPAGIREGES